MNVEMPKDLIGKDDRFLLCNKREAGILADLSGDALDQYKQLRNKGRTVLEALNAVKGKKQPWTTLCKCGHYPSQHPERGKCDYDGYSCVCKKYQRQPKPKSE